MSTIPRGIDASTGRFSETLRFNWLVPLLFLFLIFFFFFSFQGGDVVLHSNARGEKKSPWNECPPASGILVYHCHLPGQTKYYRTVIFFFCFQNLLRSRGSLPLKSSMLYTNMVDHLYSYLTWRLLRNPYIHILMIKHFLFLLKNFYLNITLCYAPSYL